MKQDNALTACNQALDRMKAVIQAIHAELDKALVDPHPQADEAQRLKDRVNDLLTEKTLSGHRLDDVLTKLRQLIDEGITDDDDAE